MKLAFWRRKPSSPSSATPAGALAAPMTHRQFLKVLVGTVGGAGLGLAGAARLAEATYTPGPPDVVDTDLTVQGNLIVDGNVGIGRASPAGKLDVGGAIYINGAQAIGSDGVVKKTYYAS